MPVTPSGNKGVRTMCESRCPSMLAIGVGLVSFAMASLAVAESVLVFGGTGNTGSRIVRHLVDAGHDVTVFVRPTSNRSRLAGLAVDYAVGDVHDRGSVDGAFDQSSPDVVIATMQSRPDQSPHGDPEIHLIGQAERAGSKHFIYLSSVGAGDDTEAQRSRYPDINYDRFARVLKEKGRVEEALMASSVGYTIIRSGAILVERGVEPPPGTGRAYFTEDQDVLGPITYDDLAVLMARCVSAPGCLNKIYHATDDTLGPEYNHWRCRRFAVTGDLASECDHLRPVGLP